MKRYIVLWDTVRCSKSSPFAAGSLVAEVLAPPEAQQALTVLEAPPNPVVLNHQGVAAFASITVYGKGGQSGYSVQRKCAAAMVAMTQVKRLQAQLQTDLEQVMSSCHESIKETTVTEGSGDLCTSCTIL